MNPYYVLPNLGIAALRLVNGLDSEARRCVGGITRWRQRRATIREFQVLSDHLLTDIGLDRSRIVATVEEVVETGNGSLLGDQTVARFVSRMQRGS